MRRHRGPVDHHISTAIASAVIRGEFVGLAAGKFTGFGGDLGRRFSGSPTGEEVLPFGFPDQLVAVDRTPFGPAVEPDPIAKPRDSGMQHHLAGSTFGHTGQVFGKDNSISSSQEVGSAGHALRVPTP